MVTFGRFPDNDFQVIDQRLSLKHCRILRKLNEETGKMVVVLEDSSSNGTYLNGELVSINKSCGGIGQTDRNLNI